MDIEVLIKEAVKRIIDEFNPEKIILFGSQEDKWDGSKKEVSGKE